MKVVIIPLLLCSLSLIAKAADICSSTSKQVDELAAQNCEIVEKMTSCAEKAIDPDMARKSITRLFETSEKEKESIIKNWKNYKSSSLAQLYNYDSRYERTKDYKPEPILDWMTSNGTADLDKEVLKNSLIDQYVEFAKKNDCTPILKTREVIVSYPPALKTKTEAELDKVLKASDYEEKKRAFFQEQNSKVLERGTYCDQNAKIRKGPWTAVASTYPPCAGNVSGLFKDNIWSASSLDSSLTSSAANEVIECIKDRVAKGAKIHHISVVSSASALNNTGEAAKTFCKKGFLALSQARAETARDNILPKIFENTDKDYLSKVQLSFNGSNGDGTSGPCPYTLKDGKEVLKNSFATTAGKKSLDDQKYVRIQVTFESNYKEIQSSEERYAPNYYCRNFYFDCRPLSH